MRKLATLALIPFVVVNSIATYVITTMQLNYNAYLLKSVESGHTIIPIIQIWKNLYGYLSLSSCLLLCCLVYLAFRQNTKDRLFWSMFVLTTFSSWLIIVGLLFFLSCSLVPVWIV